MEKVKIILENPRDDKNEIFHFSSERIWTHSQKLSWQAVGDWLLCRMVWTVQTYETLFTGKTKRSITKNKRDTKTVSFLVEDHIKVTLWGDGGRPCQEKKKNKKSCNEREMERKQIYMNSPFHFHFSTSISLTKHNVKWHEVAQSNIETFHNVDAKKYITMTSSRKSFMQHHATRCII